MQKFQSGAAGKSDSFTLVAITFHNHLEDTPPLKRKIHPSEKMSTPCVGIGCLSSVYNRCRDVIMAITIDREFKSLLFSGHTVTT